jgi:HK97 gp10 family phage protein
MDISYKLKGLNKTIDKVKKMSTKMQNRVADDIKFSGLDIETKAKNITPINKQPTVGGRLKAGTESDVSVRFQARIFNDLNYASYVEFGTRAHVIRVKNAKNLSNGKTGFGKVVNHPGTKAQPFLRPAFHQGVRDLKKAIKKSLNRL